jgi:hypothetical protein
MKADENSPVLKAVTPREATVLAEEILKRLDEEPGQGFAALRAAPPLVAAILRAHLEDELPDAFGVFNPGLVARIERVKAKFRLTAAGRRDGG